MGTNWMGALAAAVALTVLLGGCSDGTTTPHKAAASAAPMASPAPTPSGAPVAPQPRIPLPCGGLVDTPALSALASGLTLDTSSIDSSSSYPQAAVTKQAGFLNCSWTQPGQTQHALSISLLTDARAGYDDSVRTEWSSLGVGDASQFSCNGPGWSISCSASIIAGRYWAYILVGQNDRSAAQSTEALRGLAQSLVANLAKAGDPAPAWTMPATVWSPVQSCAQLGAAVPMADLFPSAPSPTVGAWNGSGNEDAAWRWAGYSDSTFYNCVWQWTPPSADQDRLVIVQIAPGAEWIWPQLAAAADITSTKISVPGADAAYYRCDSIDSNCWADALVDHSWIQATIPYSGYPNADVLLTKALTDLAAFKGA